MAFESLDSPGKTEKESAERLENQVHRRLLDKIRFGDYALGQRLPSENELCEEHGVSRPVVRAALSKLRDSGLIVSRQGAGSFVHSGVPNDQAGFGALGSVEDIAAFFHFRRVIETASVELAAERAGTKGADRLWESVEMLRAQLEGGKDGVAADIHFHLTIAELSDSRFLIETVNMLQPHWHFVGNFLRSLGVTGARKGKRMTDEHVAIVEAIAAGDPARARAAMSSHIDGSERRVFKGA